MLDMTKIAIIGKGTIGVAALLQLLSFLKSKGTLNSTEVSVMYEPSIIVTQVGESTTWRLLKLLHELLDPEEARAVLNGCGATYRKGVKFLWKNTPSRDFTIDYLDKGLHFDSAKLGDMVLPIVHAKYGIKIIEDRVTKLEGGVINSRWKFDLILDCSGSPSSQEIKYSGKYTTPEFQSVDSALLIQVPNDTKGTMTDEYSHSVFHDNGWMFMIPLQHRKAYGYLYNSKITSREEAEREFISMQGGVSKEGMKHLTWEFYYKNTIMEDKVLYLGNKLFFFEPAQALPIHFYLALLEGTLELLFGNHSYQDAEILVNRNYLDEVHGALAVIAFNYTGDMDIPTEFWASTSARAREFTNNSAHYQYRYKKYVHGKTNMLELWNHDSDLMSEYIQGFNIPQPNREGKYE